jgi:hypothetical protein
VPEPERVLAVAERDQLLGDVRVEDRLRLASRGGVAVPMLVLVAFRRRERHLFTDEVGRLDRFVKEVQNSAMDRGVQLKRVLDSFLSGRLPLDGHFRLLSLRHGAASSRPSEQ